MAPVSQQRRALYLALRSRLPGLSLVVVRTGAAQPVMAAASAPATPVVGADNDQVALDGQERAMILATRRWKRHKACFWAF
jgi:hypothetical protein